MNKIPFSLAVFLMIWIFPWFMMFLERKWHEKTWKLWENHLSTTSRTANCSVNNVNNLMKLYRKIMQFRLVCALFFIVSKCHIAEHSKLCDTQAHAHDNLAKKQSQFSRSYWVHGKCKFIALPFAFSTTLQIILMHSKQCHSKRFIEPHWI